MTGSWSAERQTERREDRRDDHRDGPGRDWGDLERTAFDRAPSAGDLDAWMLLLGAAH